MKENSDILFLFEKNKIDIMNEVVRVYYEIDELKVKFVKKNNVLKNF